MFTVLSVRYQTFGPRLWAFCIDNLLTLPLFITDYWLRGSDTPPVLMIIWLTFYEAALAAYSVGMTARFGQTLGKMITGVQVLDISENRLTLSQAWMRESVFIVFGVLSVIADSTNILAGMRPAVDLQSDPLQKFGLYGLVIWIALELAVTLASPKRRALHDYLAGTVVVRVRRAAAKPPPAAAT
jgi:uncharacterized RDD family membrane protein YckC